jgi:hypothetical protein
LTYGLFKPAHNSRDVTEGQNSSLLVMGRLTSRFAAQTGPASIRVAGGIAVEEHIPASPLSSSGRDLASRMRMCRAFPSGQRKQAGDNMSEMTLRFVE